MSDHDDEVGAIEEALRAQGYEVKLQELPDGKFLAEAIPIGVTRSGPGITFRGDTRLEAAGRVRRALPPTA